MPVPDPRPEPSSPDARPEPGGPEPAPDPAVPGRHRLRLDGPAPSAPPQAALVLGYARDPAAHRALAVAIDLARRLDAHLHVAHVVDLDDYPVDPDSPSWEADARDAIARQQRDVETALADQSPGSWTYHASRGDPARLLAALADEHDALFVVVGTHGEGAAATLGRLFRGRSVTHGLIGRHHRPVLVVPPDDADPDRVR